MGRRHDGQIARDDGTAPLIARLGQAPPLSNPEAAQARVDEIADALPAALREGPARDLLAALADHSTFLWSLASRDPARLVRLFEEAPEAADARIIAVQRAAGRAGRAPRPTSMRSARPCGGTGPSTRSSSRSPISAVSGRWSG